MIQYPCAYVYPGNHRRCRRDFDDHGVPQMGWRNQTADGHAWVGPNGETVPKLAPPTPYHCAACGAETTHADVLTVGRTCQSCGADAVEMIP